MVASCVSTSGTARWLSNARRWMNPFERLEPPRGLSDTSNARLHSPPTVRWPNLLQHSTRECVLNSQPRATMSTVASGEGSGNTALHRVVQIPADTSRDDTLTILAASRNESGSRENVRELLARDPAWIDRLGSLAADAEDALVAQGRDQVLLEEAARAELGVVRASLRQPSDGPLERLLVERVALCWLNVTTAETRRAMLWKRAVPVDSVEFWDRHVSRLHSDFLRATKVLATVRRLRLPTVQLNIAQQQVNVANGTQAHCG